MPEPDERERPKPAPSTSGGGEPGPADAPEAGQPQDPCPICGAPLFGVHCKLICPNCGYREDCSDLFRL